MKETTVSAELRGEIAAVVGRLFSTQSMLSTALDFLEARRESPSVTKEDRDLDSKFVALLRKHALPSGVEWDDPFMRELSRAMTAVQTQDRLARRIRGFREEHRDVAPQLEAIG